MPSILSKLYERTLNKLPGFRHKAVQAPVEEPAPKPKYDLYLAALHVPGEYNFPVALLKLDHDPDAGVYAVRQRVKSLSVARFDVDLRGSLGRNAGGEPFSLLKHEPNNRDVFVLVAEGLEGGHPLLPSTIGTWLGRLPDPTYDDMRHLSERLKKEAAK